MGGISCIAPLDLGRCGLLLHFLSQAEGTFRAQSYIAICAGGMLVPLVAGVTKVS